MAPLTACLWLFSPGFLHGAEPEFDLVIRHGKLVDGTGNPWFDGDVAIKGGRIAGMGRVAGAAKREIDARGLVVAPGFIDIHSHSDWLLLEDGAVIRTRATSALSRACSVSPCLAVACENRAVIAS